MLAFEFLTLTSVQMIRVYKARALYKKTRLLKNLMTKESMASNSKFSVWIKAFLLLFTGNRACIGESLYQIQLEN